MRLAFVIFAAIEFVAVIYAIVGIGKYLFNKMVSKYNKILDRCAVDLAYRNKIASCIFFFQDMGPNISSFSVISLFITDKENVSALIIIFFVGIIIKEESRKIKNLFYDEIDKRSKKCQLEP